MTATDKNKFFKAKHVKVTPYILIVVVLILVIIITLSSRRGFDKTLEKYMDATIAGDAEAVVDLLHDSYVEGLIENGDIESKRDLIQRVQKKLDWYSSQADLHRGENGERFEYIAKLEDIKDEETSTVPFSLRYIYGDALDSIKEVKQVYITYMCDYYNTAFDRDDEWQITADYYICFVKIGQSWYLGEITEYKQFG